MDTKTLRDVRIKDADKGEVTAVFATLGVKDHDGDVIVKGAIENGAPVRISAYGHRSWKGELPVGKGVIREVGDEAVFEGRFFLNTTHGKDTFNVVKEMDDLQEWSFSLDNVKQERGQLDDGTTANFIKEVTITEVSPVLKGAGIATRTVDVKGKQLNSELRSELRDAGRQRFGAPDTHVWLEDFDVDDDWVVYAISPDDGEMQLVQVPFTRTDDEVSLGDTETEVERTMNFAPKQGVRFTEQADAVLADVKQLADRATEVVALRAEKGKAIGEESAEQLLAVADAMKQLQEQLEQAAESEPEPDASDAARTEYLRYVALTQGVEA